MPSVFAVPIFFICMRECIETSIIVSTLLAFLHQTLPANDDAKIKKQLVRQIWWGVGLGLLIVLIIGGGMIGAFYGLGKDIFSKTEDLWEGILGILASIIITIMGAALLRVSRLQEKWRIKISKAIEFKGQSRAYLTFGTRFKKWCERYAMFVLPFITVLREGLEAVIFIGGVGIGMPASSFPLAVFTGLFVGVLVGYLIYKGGNKASLQIFLVVSTCFLYLVAAGLFSRGVWSFGIRQWNQLVGGDASEVGSGPGSYDIRQSVWHVNCCNAETNGGWGIFNALLGWENSATLGSVISYNLYWMMVIGIFAAMRFKEVKGHWPLLGRWHKSKLVAESNQSDQNITTEGGPATTSEFNKEVGKATVVECEEIPDSPKA